MKQVKKAVFVVAGFGTRFLPITKAVPKEMLPIVDTPIIQLLVEQAVAAGIEDIIFVTGRGKASIENHFDTSYELERTLVEKDKTDRLAEVENISKLANFAYVRQPIQRGDGHAILCAKPFLDDDEPILMVFPDYIMPSGNQSFQRMIAAFDQTGETIIGLDEVPEEMVSQYGVIQPGVEDDNSVEIKGFVEKPKSNAPSRLINNGYAVLAPSFWDNMVDADSNTDDGEIRVADGYIRILEAGGKLVGVKPTEPGYDCGNKLGYLKACVDFALVHPDLNGEFKAFIKKTAARL
jgi:UTP--glucose-1-phosphate uridylyltransferase